MKKLILILFVTGLAFSLHAQKSKSKTADDEIKVPMSAERWTFPAGTAEFGSHNGVPSLKIVNGTVKAVVKDVTFTNGTIEFDMDPQDERFTGIFFRRVDDLESEYFYLRTGRAGNLVAMDAVQYAPFQKGVNMWDMLPQFQGPADIRRNQWNHVKLVISGAQMLAYVNNLSRPALEIPRLEGSSKSGSIAFTGKCTISNLVIRPDVVEGLPAQEGFDPTHHDPRYIRTWQVSEPQALPKGREVFDGDFPKLQSSWQNLEAERRGLINLTKVFGASESRRFVWLRTKLITTTELRRKISFGFSDEIWVYVNRQGYYADKNLYISGGMRKVPDGRISIENGQCDVVLKPGENELLVAVANDFFGWGMIARLDDMEGITVSTDFPAPVNPPSDLSKYTGVYGASGSEEKITITAKGSTLMGHGTGDSPVELEYFDKDKFRYAQAGVVLEFHPDENKMILTQGTTQMTFTKQ